MTCLRQPESQAGNGVHSRMVSYSPTDGVGGRELTELRTHHGRGTPGMASDTFTVEEVGQLVRKWFPSPPPPPTQGGGRRSLHRRWPAARGVLTPCECAGLLAAGGGALGARDPQPAQPP